MGCLAMASMAGKAVLNTPSTLVAKMVWICAGASVLLLPWPGGNAGIGDDEVELAQAADPGFHGFAAGDVAQGFGDAERPGCGRWR